MFFQLGCNMVKKCLQKGYCDVSDVKVETLFLLEMQQWIDNFNPSERAASITVLRLMGHFWTTFFSDLSSSNHFIILSICGT